MIQSMTGFGKSSIDFSHKKINIQLKSLNSKRFDIYARIPAEYREKELVLHKMISDEVSRGKIDFRLSVEGSSGEGANKINTSVLQQYMKDLKAVLSEDASELALLKMAVTLPDAVTTAEEEIDEEEFEAVKTCLSQALEQLNQYRNDEGKSLEEDFRLRIKLLTELLEEVKRIDPKRMQNMRERLNNAVAELKVEVDESRFEQELIYYAEKFDITEEITRLKNHLNYFSQTLDLPESNGRKLGFITQEIGREINTIGSKSNDLEMQKLVVEMKDELEKIKEQILNVL
ncbi:MAG TPA: YicC/YloC family endoribonuclease [Flavobacteriaceae bacterium]|nr:YicC/YloC family endoribonuclease [Flavobacteriaceae bacterium]